MTRLTSRDLEILATVERFRLVSARQLERLHFHTGTPLSNARSCRRRLERLVHLGVLTRLTRRVGGVRAGSAGYIYTLAPAGQRLQARGTKRARSPWTPGAAFTSHTLAVTELFVRLVEAERRGLLEVVRFDPEPDCWRWWNGPGGARVVLKPDAYAVLGAGAYEDAWFVEIDRGTEAPSTFARKLTAYRSHWQSGREQALTGIYPRVLILVPDEARKATLVTVAAQQPAEAWRLFQIGLASDAIAMLGGQR
jgi:hypothetical protein